MKTVHVLEKIVLLKPGAIEIFTEIHGIYESEEKALDALNNELYKDHFEITEWQVE